MLEVNQHLDAALSRLHEIDTEMTAFRMSTHGVESVLRDLTVAKIVLSQLEVSE